MKEKQKRPVSTHRKGRVKSKNTPVSATKKSAQLTGKPKQVNKMQKSGFTELKLWFPNSTLQNLKQLLEEMGYPAPKPDKSGNEKRNLQDIVDAINHLVAANIKKQSADNQLWSEAETAIDQKLMRVYEVCKHRAKAEEQNVAEIAKFMNESGYPTPEAIREQSSKAVSWTKGDVIKLKKDMNKKLSSNKPSKQP